MVSKNNSMDPLRSEILNLIQYISRMREEVARVSQRSDDRTHFESVSQHLEEIVGSTENATNQIVEHIEGVDNVVAKTAFESGCLVVSHGIA